MQQQQRVLRRQLSKTMPPHNISSRRWLLAALMVIAVSFTASVAAFTTTPFGRLASRSCLPSMSTVTSTSSRKADATTGTAMTEEDDALPQPRTFREAEILGLKRMQQGNYQEALKGTSVVLSVVFIH
jgi:hypothetical protein